MRAPSRSVDPTGTDVWRRLRGPLAIVAGVVAAGIVVALLQGRATGGPLDPRSGLKSGGRALAVLLEERGVEVHRTRTLADALDAAAGEDATGTTLLVTEPDLLVRSQLRRLARTPVPHVVLFEPGDKVLGAFAPDAVPAGDALRLTRAPDCDLRAATRAGAVRVDGPMYRTRSGTGPLAAQTCYGDGTRGALVRLSGVPRPGPSAGTATGPGRTVDVVGTSVSFSNARLADEGNAALALNLLGTHQRLVWYVPSLSDVPVPASPDGSGPGSLFGLLPAGLRFGVVQVVVGVALLMLVFARRLGPVVAEPLPVVVRASEAVEGRARLYHRARARQRAAGALREATRSRLAPVLGLPSRAGFDVVSAAAAERTGRPVSDVARVLGSPASDPTSGGPPDDTALVRLANDLDTLEQEVRRS